ncbi:4,5-DOPA dioxygenase extradiol [Myroides sp. 1354]|uniref:4,5-DOPA-extradiol-dioxygenase n=1 Tax=unclassified Myroides TaxID=2642485 RepID=UPI0025761491|nr:MULTISPECIES: 4,5-DOPA dioxygenase extradiol [unclassified Myroides]MDM1046196.1 4,5-DOPA dioxygenase extradiol [Myroides sp. R163-1]MDM1057088.1 4,5-DOPA dioxygenase extradiol [Myroides sp. 1354]MDM1070327.1 4,5-DOPA dioxygenase extradiol [Myroides sp. 1372]
MQSLQDLYRFSQTLSYSETIMPTLFIGHGSPMNAISDTVFSQNWHQLGQSLPTPKAILVISAHWLTKGSAITAMDFPETIHDFRGFPQPLFEVDYPAPGAPDLAKSIQEMAKPVDLHLDHDWGLDHGTWSITRHMFPKADIPVLQLSIDYYKPLEYHYQLATQLRELRKKGILIIGSGNMIHNLRMLSWDQMENNYGFDWAHEINAVLQQHIAENKVQYLIDYEKLHPQISLAVPTLEHYIPMLYNLGLKEAKDELLFFNDAYVGGSLSMTSFMYYQ